MPEFTLSDLAYYLAYRVMPLYAFQDFAKAIETQKKWGANAGAFFFFMACKMAKTELTPTRETAELFQVELGQLDELRDYYLVTYPEPIPVDMSSTDATALVEQKTKVVLAPYFSAIVHQRGSMEAEHYFVLGQAPFGGGTTFRCVTADNKNCNLGPGPVAEKEDFLARVREAISAKS